MGVAQDGRRHFWLMANLGSIIDYLESVGVSTADTEILGADGTAWNGKKLPVTEPPLLMKKTRDELLSYVDTPFSSDYPSHTQRVETGVKLTTAGAARVVGQKRQVGECLMVEASRKKSPGRVTRKRFNI